MRASSLASHSLTLAFGFGLSLACSSADRGSQTDPTAALSPTAAPSPEPRWPVVGEPAPPLSLDTLAGSRVSLPRFDADRAAVLIFGSFS